MKKSRAKRSVRKKVSKSSKLEAAFIHSWKLRGYPMPEEEHRFHPTRKWRFDFAWPEQKIALEVEGGTFTTSRHTTGMGFHRDCEKYNEAALHGWTVIRADEKMIRSGAARIFAERALRLDRDFDGNA